ncbi:MAG: caspase family protein [Kofleriaceae bacterium]
MKILVALLVLLATAHAGTRRVAIIVGNNRGNGDRPALHYAEADAAKFAEVLRELGGIEREDLFVLEGRDKAELQTALARAKEHITAFHRDPTNRVVVVFYFSGHSDGEALELGNDRLSFGELRRWLAGAGADVRVALVDSCKSGALLAIKGGTPGPSFQIRLTDDVASTGEALLTSSAADEVALESREIGGSFFTHHFISGLRGAADTSGDGVVTLTEAYQYAYVHTIKTTGETVIGPQHPAYDYRLSGQGELVLAELTKPTARLALPSGFDRILVIDRAHEQVIAEVAADARDTIAVPPGRYAIRAWRGTRVYAGQVAIGIDERRDVHTNDLDLTDSVTTTSKGGDDLAPWHVLATVGASGGVADNVGVRGSTRIELVSPRGLSAALSVSSRSNTFRESTALALVGYRTGLTRGALHGWLGAELGTGFVLQTGLMHDVPAAYTAALAFGAYAGISVDVAPRWSIALTPAYDAAVLRRDGKAALVGLPGIWFGVGVKL